MKKKGCINKNNKVELKYLPPKAMVMFFEMLCSCTATIQLEVDHNKEEAAWLLVNRFTSAHVSCGFMTPLLEELPNPTKRFNINISQDKDN